MVLVRELRRFSREENAERRKFPADDICKRSRGEKINERFAETRGIRTDSGSFDLRVDAPEETVVPRIQSPVCKKNPQSCEISQSRNIVSAPRTENPAIVLRRHTNVIRRGEGAGELCEKLSSDSRSLLRAVNSVAEEARSVFREQPVLFRSIEIQKLERIREAGFNHHQRLRMICRPDFRPVFLLLKRRAVALIIHGSKDFSGVSAGVLEDLPR